MDLKPNSQPPPVKVGILRPFSSAIGDFTKMVDPGALRFLFASSFNCLRNDTSLVGVMFVSEPWALHMGDLGCLCKVKNLGASTDPEFT